MDDQSTGKKNDVFRSSYVILHHIYLEVAVGAIHPSRVPSSDELSVPAPG